MPFSLALLWLAYDWCSCKISNFPYFLHQFGSWNSYQFTSTMTVSSNICYWLANISQSDLWSSPQCVTTMTRQRHIWIYHFCIDMPIYIHCIGLVWMSWREIFWPKVSETLVATLLYAMPFFNMNTVSCSDCRHLVSLCRSHVNRVWGESALLLFDPAGKDFFCKGVGISWSHKFI